MTRNQKIKNVVDNSPNMKHLLTIIEKMNPDVFNKMNIKNVSKSKWKYNFADIVNVTGLDFKDIKFMVTKQLQYSNKTNCI